MTDRIKGFVVMLENDYRIDDMEAVKSAIEMIKCVAKVSPLVSDMDDMLARERVKLELRQKLFDVLK